MGNLDGRFGERTSWLGSRKGRLKSLFFDDDDVPIALRRRTSFNGSGSRNRVRSGIAFLCVHERYGHTWLAGAHDDVRNADRCSGPYSAEVRMQVAQAARGNEFQYAMSTPSLVRT